LRFEDFFINLNDYIQLAIGVLNKLRSSRHKFCKAMINADRPVTRF